MKQLLNNFCVFILSFQRPQLTTLKMLKKYGYSGDYRIVLSTDDKCIDEYKKVVPQEKILVFDKQEICKDKGYIDTMNGNGNFNPNGSIYARAFICKTAKQMNIPYFCMADDDIVSLYHHEVIEGKKKSKTAKTIDEVFAAFIEFLNGHERLTTINPAFCLYGGADGRFGQQASRLMFQFFIYKTKNIRKFVGLRSEDFNHCFLNFDNIYFTYYHLTFSSPEMGANDGGINYKEGVPSTFYMLVTHPTGVQMLPNNKKRILQNRIFPKIVSEDYKKK